MHRFLVPFLAVVFLCSGAQALTLPSAFAGSDGAFTPNSNVTVDLSLAATGAWNETPGAGNGVYDPAQWAVIFRFTTFNVPNNVTVKFQNHPSGAPVIFLVQGNVDIHGEINLNGANGHLDTGPTSASIPGPGGFRGGRGSRIGTAAQAGQGPGGGPLVTNGGNAAYGELASERTGATYGNAGLFPLIGGSGGAGEPAPAGDGSGGGAGGGAILIATEGTMTNDGAIRANGGNGIYCWSSGSGSGGAIRLIANTLQGSGEISAVGGGVCSAYGGAGRIRIEANSNNLTAVSSPAYSVGIPGDTPRIFRAPGDNIPEIRAVELGGKPVPRDPRPGQTIPPDVQIADPGLTTLHIEALHVPAGSMVTVRVVPVSGQDQVYQATYDGPGDEPNQTLWTADVNLAGGFSTVQVYAALVN
jgi:hypothetical protein